MSDNRHNSKLAAGLVPVRQVGQDGVSRTVYIRQDDGAAVAEVPETLRMKRPLAGLARVKETSLTSADSLGLGSTVEESDRTVSNLLDEVERNPELMEDEEFRDQMVAATGYTQVRSQARSQAWGWPEQNCPVPASGGDTDGGEVIDPGSADGMDEDAFNLDEPPVEEPCFIDMQELERNQPEVYEESLCDGETVVFSKIDPEVEQNIRESVEQAEQQRREDNPETAQNRIWTAQDEKRRCEQAVADYADDGDRPVEGRPVKEQKDRVRRRREESGMIPKGSAGDRNTPDMRNKNGSVQLWVNPKSKFTIYELHAKLDEMMSGTGDGVIGDAMKSRQMQPEMYQKLHRRKVAQEMARNIRERRGMTRGEANQERRRIQKEMRKGEHVPTKSEKWDDRLSRRKTKRRDREAEGKSKRKDEQARKRWREEQRKLWERRQREQSPNAG